MRIYPLFLLLMPVLFTACSQKVTVSALQPAEIAQASQTKKIAVTAFRTDYVNLADKIEASIASQSIDGKPYFTPINRSDLDKIIKEQKLQNSGLLEPSTVVEVGNLLGAQAIISGSVNKPSMKDDYYYVERTKCKDDKCWKVRVSCKKRTITLSAQIRMIDVSNAGIIYADTPSRKRQWSHCADDTRTLPSLNAGAQQLARSIANSFAYKLTPHYQNISVSLLEDPDLEYDELQERLLKNALVYIEQKRYDKAQQLLERLVESTHQQSYVPLYDLGVLYEAQGNFSEAQHYYDAADALTIEPVEEINLAVNRIARLIKQEKVAQRQIAR